MVKAAERGRYVAFGRVFSGIARSDSTVRIMGPNYVPGKKQDLFAHKKISTLVFFSGKRQDTLHAIGVGNLCGLTGIDQFLTSAGTITTSNEVRQLRTQIGTCALS